MTTNPSPDPDLAQTLGQALVTFDAIRHLSRRYEDRSPDLFAAFMSAAVAAADGRDAVLTAGSRPAQSPFAIEPGERAPGADPDEAADWIAASAAVLATRLDHAAALAVMSQDRHACHDAAAAAKQIHQLLARADDTHTR